MVWNEASRGNTIDRWITAYRRGGLDALRPRPRVDVGRSRSDHARWLDEAARLRREVPGRSAAAIVDIVGRAHGVWLSERTVPAHLARNGLHRAALSAEQVKVFGRFEASRPNEIWIGDVLVGPFVPHPRAAGSKRAKLFVLVDDYSRLLVRGQWMPEENTRAGQHVLRTAMERRGVPEVLYVDNGAPFAKRAVGPDVRGDGHPPGALQALRAPGSRQAGTVEPIHPRTVPPRSRDHRDHQLRRTE